jgi:hypothetical protein
MSNLKKSIMQKSKRLALIATVLSLFSSCATNTYYYSGRGTADDSAGPQSAFEIYSQLQESATSFNTRAVLVDGEAIEGLAGGVTWGGEKEASSSLLTRVMGPDSDYFKSIINDMDETGQKKFYRDFLGNYVKNANGYRTYRTEEGVVLDLARDVVDVDGNPKTIDMAGLQGIDFETAELDVLKEKFGYWIDQTEGKPMAFMKPDTRRKFFKGKLPGQTEAMPKSYSSWVAHFGPAEKHVGAAHGHHGGSGGWEINFKPMGTYGEFEEQVAWFRKALKNAGKLFQAPGHQRMVFRKHPELKKSKLSEMYRAIQALIVVDGVRGGTGIETANYKDVQSDRTLKSLSSYRGVIRLEGSKWAPNTLAVEFRAGTKDLRLARFYQTALASRVASNDWGGMSDIGSYKLFDDMYFNADEISTRFGVSEDIAEKAINNLSGITNQFLLPFWHWESEGLPFLSKEKKQLIKGMTKGFIEQVAALDGGGETVKSNARNIMREWVRSANLSEELHNYIRPKRAAELTEDLLFFSPDGNGVNRGITRLTDQLLGQASVDGMDEDAVRKVLEFSLASPNLGKASVATSLSASGAAITHQQVKKVFDTFEMENITKRMAKAQSIVVANAGSNAAGMVDVNAIDLGIEYSGRMPLRLRADFTPDRLADNKKAWLATYSDLSQDERVNFIKKVADDLKVELGGSGDPIRVEENGHGHGLDISWEIRDSQQRKWIVEWDGVGRSYTETGEVIADSMRGGSIELVTPKFTPQADEMKSVFKVFDQNNVLPRLQSGGGHINIDLAAFEGKPKQLARFMSIFHEHRGTIALMFQRINRLRNAEAIDISDNFSDKLKNFNGSETDLKKLLYNEEYFNTRFGRKSRYIQLDLSAYFQDVIPEEFVTEDFDIGNPTEAWRRQFRVDPRIRKAEFRMFNAPRDPAESALQIRLVRAMLHKALNEDDELAGTVQKVDFEGLLKNPAKAYDDLTKMCDDLKLNVADFRPAIAEGLSETDLYTRSIFYETLDEKLALFKHQTGWGSAVDPRSTAIGSDGRHWVDGPADRLNTMDNSHRLSAAREAMRQRDALVPDRIFPTRFKRTDSCIDSISPFLQ